MITFTTRTRSAVVRHLDDGTYTIDLSAVVHPSRPELGSKLLRRRATGSRFTAIGIAQDWVGPKHQVVEA